MAEQANQPNRIFLRFITNAQFRVFPFLNERKITNGRFDTVTLQIASTVR
jgi:hypothetical protein